MFFNAKEKVRETHFNCSDQQENSNQTKVSQKVPSYLKRPQTVLLHLFSLSQITEAVCWFRWRGSGRGGRGLVCLRSASLLKEVSCFQGNGSGWGVRGLGCGLSFTLSLCQINLPTLHCMTSKNAKMNAGRSNKSVRLTWSLILGAAPPPPATLNVTVPTQLSKTMETNMQLGWH